MTRKIVKLVIGLALSIAISVGLFVLKSNLEYFEHEKPSETFVGALSDLSYTSKDDTVKAFLTNELTGATAQPVYTSYEKINDLSRVDIENLALEQNVKAQIESAESVSINYTCDNESKSTKACLLRMNGEYRYYVSPSSNGEVLTNSYFNSVLNGAKYLNCTSTTAVNMRLVNPKATADATYRQTIMFDNDIAYIDQELPGMDYEMYFTEASNSINVYLEHPQKDDDKFYSLSDINRDLRSQNMEYKVYLTKGGERVALESLSTLQDITNFMFMMKLDASYFIKTSSGFSMPDEKYKEVCRLMVGENAYAEMKQAWDEYHIHFKSDYYVSDGRLSASKTVLTMSNGDDVFALTIVVNYTDFGTTEVTLPNSTEG